MNNKIDDIVKEFEWWIDLLTNDEPTSEVFEFAEFCYVNLPALLAEIKRLQDEETPCDT